MKFQDSTLSATNAILVSQVCITTILVLLWQILKNYQDQKFSSDMVFIMNFIKISPLMPKVLMS